MAMILLVGTSVAALEGIAQTLSAIGHSTRVAATISDGRDFALTSRPLIAIVERSLAAESSAEMLGLPLASGGALVLFRTSATRSELLAPPLLRVVLADLTLPFERNRLVALVKHVEERANVTGRSTPKESPEQRTP